MKLINEVLQRLKNYGNFRVLGWRVQELQNEVNCMNDSKDFQYAESIRSGNSHVTSRPVSFPPHPIPERDVETFFRNAEPQRRAAKHSTHTWYIRKRFCKSRCILHQLHITKNCISGVHRSRSHFIHPVEPPTLKPDEQVATTQWQAP